MGLQTVSPSCRRSAFIGRAGRRLGAVFSVVAGPLSHSTGAVLILGEAVAGLSPPQVIAG